MIAQNVRKLFLFNSGVAHFYAACCIDDMNRRYVLGYEIDATFGFGLKKSSIDGNRYLDYL